jgi:hypothetical protein
MAVSLMINTKQWLNACYIEADYRRLYQDLSFLEEYGQGLEAE